MQNLESIEKNNKNEVRADKVKSSEVDQLIEQYLPFATSIANKVSRALNTGRDCFDDIICNARLGLLEAARRFDTKHKVDFKTFAYYRIKGAIYDGLRKTGWIPRSLYSKLKIEEASNDCLKTISDRIQESSAGAKANVDAIYDTVNNLTSVYVMSIDGLEDFELEDKQASKDIEHKAEFQKVKVQMKDAIDSLPDKERKLVKMYYFQNMTLQEIGDKLKLSKSWTSRLHARALDTLFKKMNYFSNRKKNDLGSMPLSH